MSYHKRDVIKGVYGKFSKIQEELDEALEATEQGCKILELVELSDLYGAIEAYVESEHNLSMDDLKQMSDLTKKAFIEGAR